MSGVSDDDFARILASEGAAQAQSKPVKARLLRRDGQPGAGVPPFSFTYSAAPRPWLRLSLQVATIAVAAAVGWYSGAHAPNNHATATDVAQLSARLAAVEDQARERETVLHQQHAADMSALHKLVEGAGKDLEALRNGQRLAQAQRDEANLKLTQLTERLDKLEMGQAPTGSIARPAPQAQASPQITSQGTAQGTAQGNSQASRPVVAKASPPAAAAPPAPRLRSGPPPGGYVLGEIRNGSAVVHSHRGPVDVWPGTLLPGAGRVQAILRRNGQWVVTTTNGEIDADGY